MLFVRPAISCSRWYFVAAALLCALLISGCEGPSGGMGNVKIGDPVPEFELRGIDGQTYSSEGLLGTPYLVSVFATWCPPCKIEMEHFEKDIWQPLKDSGVGVYGINYGDEGDDLIAEFGREHGLSFPLLVDLAGDFQSKAGVRGVPTAYVVGKDGRIKSIHEGYSEEAVSVIKQELQHEL